MAASRPARRPGAGTPLIVLAEPGPTGRRPEPPGAPVVYAYAHPLDRPARDAAAPVVGDSTHDRLVASLPLRDFYRRALGVGERRRLVVAALPADDLPCPGAGCRSRDGVHGVHGLLADLMSSGHHVLAVPEPGPGGCDAGAGLGVQLRNGLRLMPPDADWRAALVAADWIVGPPGRITRYGTLVGVPVLPGSTPVAARLEEATARWRPERVRPEVERITSEPGRFDRNIRRLMYGLLRLPQPATIPVADPVSPPFRIETPAGRRDSACPAGRPSHACQGG